MRDDVARGRCVDVRERAANDRGIAEAEEREIKTVGGSVTARAFLGERDATEYRVGRLEPFLGVGWAAVLASGQTEDEKESG